jgi:hypothetical protein
VKTFLITAGAVIAAATVLVGFASAISTTDRDAESKKAKDFCAQFHLTGEDADNCVFAKYNDLHTDAELTERFSK